MSEETKQKFDKFAGETHELFEFFTKRLDEKKYSATSIYSFFMMGFVQSAYTFNTTEQEFDDSLSRMKENFLIAKKHKHLEENR